MADDESMAVPSGPVHLPEPNISSIKNKIRRQAAYMKLKKEKLKVCKTSVF